MLSLLLAVVLSADQIALENDYVQTALIADLPFPVDHRRSGCASGRG